MTASLQASIRAAFRHVGMAVPDIAMAVAWYGRHFGFHEAESMRLDGIGANVTFIEGQGLRIELFQFDDGAGQVAPHRSVPVEDLRAGGLSHLAFTVQGLDARVAAMQADGVAVRVPPSRSANGTMIAFINDCAGNVIELVQPPE